MHRRKAEEILRSLSLKRPWPPESQKGQGKKGQKGKGKREEKKDEKKKKDEKGKKKKDKKKKKSKKDKKDKKKKKVRKEDEGMVDQARRYVGMSFEASWLDLTPLSFRGMCAHECECLSDSKELLSMYLSRASVLVFLRDSVKAGLRDLIKP